MCWESWCFDLLFYIVLSFHVILRDHAQVVSLALLQAKYTIPPPSRQERHNPNLVIQKVPRHAYSLEHVS